MNYLSYVYRYQLIYCTVKTPAQLLELHILYSTVHRIVGDTADERQETSTRRLYFYVKKYCTV